MMIPGFPYLEFSNAVQAVLDVILIGFFGMYMSKIFLRPEVSVKLWWKLGVPPNVQAAFAIFVYTIGDAINRSYFWFRRHEYHVTHDIGWLPTWPVAIGGFLVVIGIIYKIRVFTSPMGPLFWFGATLFACVLGAAATYLPY